MKYRLLLKPEAIAGKLLIPGNASRCLHPLCSPWIWSLMVIPSM
ncbi:MAG: hypothetical protein U1F71_12475 [Verrucomicrobiaceae bacterium]